MCSCFDKSFNLTDARRDWQKYTGSQLCLVTRSITSKDASAAVSEIKDRSDIQLPETCYTMTGGDLGPVAGKVYVKQQFVPSGVELLSISRNPPETANHVPHQEDKHLLLVRSEPLERLFESESHDLIASYTQQRVDEIVCLLYHDPAQVRSFTIRIDIDPCACFQTSLTRRGFCARFEAPAEGDSTEMFRRRAMVTNWICASASLTVLQTRRHAMENVQFGRG